MKKLIIIIAVFIVALLLSITIYGKNYFQTQNSSSSKEKVSLRLKWINQAQFAGYYVARSENFYSNDNIDVAINPGGPDISPIQTVVSGTDHFGITGADQILLAREKGVPIVSLAVIYRSSPVSLVSKKDSGITLPQDLEGKRVAIAYGRDEEVIYKALLSKEKINRKNIKEVPLTFDLSQLIENKVDAQIVYEMNEPVLLKQKEIEVNLIKPRDYGINLYADTLFTTEEMIAKKPEIVRKFVKDSILGWEESFNNPDKAIDEVMKVNSFLDRSHQKSFLELSKPLIVNGEGIGYSLFDDWQKMQKILIDQGVMKSEVDLTKSYTNDFLPQ